MHGCLEHRHCRSLSYLQHERSVIPGTVTRFCDCHGRRFALWLFQLSLLTSLAVACQFRCQAQITGTPDPFEEWRAAVRLVGVPLSIQAAEEPDDFDAEWNRLSAIYKYRDWPIHGTALSQAWNGIEQNTIKALNILTIIAEIDNHKPGGFDILVKSLRNNDTEDKRNDRDSTIETRLLAELGKAALKSGFRDAEDNLSNAISYLLSVQRDISRQRVSIPIAIDYHPSWQGVYPNDLIRIQNTSATDFSDGIVVVSVHMSNGRTFTHVHSVDQWKSGSALQGFYPYFDSDSGYINARTGEHPERVDVAAYFLYGSALAVANSTYTLTPDLWAKIVQDYCSRVTYRGNYLGGYTESNSDSNTSQYYPAGFQFSFDGLRTLPIKSVVIRFWTSTNGVKSARWTYDAGSPVGSGRLQAFRSPQLDGGAPEHIEVTLGFFGTDFEQRITVY